MTQEEIQLLLKYLAAMLPYGVICKRYENAYELVDIDIKRGLVYLLRGEQYVPYSVISGDEIKPYLRPMSSMTEEEKREFIDATDGELRYSEVFDVIKPLCASEDFCASFASYLKAINWLNKYHFDYSGLIPLGLAIEITEDNNPYKEL